MHVQIHALLLAKRKGWQNYVGHFASTKASKDRWEECMVVGQVRATRKRDAAASAEKLTFLEVMYRDGRARWYPEALVSDQIFTYDTVDAYLADCGVTFEDWAGIFQHGVPNKAGEQQAATPEFIQMWRDYYKL